MKYFYTTIWNQYLSTMLSIKNERKIIFQGILLGMILTIIGTIYGFITPFVFLTILSAILIYIINRHNSYKIFIFIIPFLPEGLSIRLSESLPLITAYRMIYIIFIIDELIVKGKINILIKTIKQDKFTKYMLLFILANLVSIIFNFRISSIADLIAFTLEKILLYYIIIINIRSKKQLEEFINIIIYSASILCILGIIEYILQFNLFSLLNITNDSSVLTYDPYLRMGSLRVMTSFGHALAYGMYLTLVLPLVIYKIKLTKGKNNEKACLYIFMLIILLINIFLTSSRSILIVVATQYFILFMFKNIKNKIKDVLTAIAIIFILFTATQMPVVNEISIVKTIDNNFKSLSDTFLGTNYISDFGRNDEPFTYRLILIEEAINRKGKEFLVGTGVNSMNENPIKRISWRLNPWNDNVVVFKSIDNYYLLKYFESGVIVLVSILLLFIAILINLFKNYRKDKLYIFLFTAFIGYMIELTMVDEIGTIQYMFILLSLYSVNYNIVRLKENKYE